MPAIDAAAMLAASVPMVRTLNLEFVETGPTRAVLRLPDQPAFHNHIAGPHAGAMFTLAESASGAIVIAAFGHLLSKATPLAVTSTIRYVKVAKGEVTATATMGRPAEEIIVELEAGKRPEFDVLVEIARADGVPCAQMSITWTLKPHAAQA